MGVAPGFLCTVLRINLTTLSKFNLIQTSCSERKFENWFDDYGVFERPITHDFHVWKTSFSHSDHFLNFYRVEWLYNVFFYVVLLECALQTGKVQLSFDHPYYSTMHKKNTNKNFQIATIPVSLWSALDVPPGFIDLVKCLKSVKFISHVVI